jgi:transposase InsO family protein
VRVYLDNGVPFWEWRMQQICWQADELWVAYLRAKAEAEQKLLPFEEPPLSRKRLWNPRDDYGWRSA